MITANAIRHEFKEAYSKRTHIARVKAILILKLKCARAYAQTMGWIGPSRNFDASPIGFPPGQMERVIARFRDPSLLDIQREWLSSLCELYDPDWKRLVPSDVLPLVVDRNSVEVRNWRISVLSRDGRQCQRCPSNKNLHAHHIAHWADFPHLRIDVDNGLTLCQPCHLKAH